VRWLNHYPSGPPQFLPGRHPLDYQPLAAYPRYDSAVLPTLYPQCDLGHLKHPLQRWDRTGPKVTSSEGFHHPLCTKVLVEPLDSALCHHFPFRDETTTRERLAKLWSSVDGLSGSRALTSPTAAHMWDRYWSTDAVYRGDWADVIDFLTRTKGVELQRWTELVDAADTVVARWY
jgi:hypothetical protein